MSESDIARAARIDRWIKLTGLVPPDERPQLPPPKVSLAFPKAKRKPETSPFANYPLSDSIEVRYDPEVPFGIVRVFNIADELLQEINVIREPALPTNPWPIAWGST